MPGSWATLATCSSERSPASAGSRRSEAKTTPGTSMRPLCGMTQRKAVSRSSCTPPSLRTPAGISLTLLRHLELAHPLAGVGDHDVEGACLFGHEGGGHGDARDQGHPSLVAL